MPEAAITLGQTLPSAYALGSIGLVTAALVLPAGIGYARPRRRDRSTTAGRETALATPSANEHPLMSRPLHQEVEMLKSMRRWRLIAGLSLIAVSAIVAIVGYLKISLEPEIARQIPFLASAGLATLILAVAGGSLLIADQIRAEDERVDEIERALAHLAEVIRPTVEQPTRARKQPR